MDKCAVFYESWQMECCGDPFQVGGRVKWLVFPCTTLNTPVDMGQVDFCYEAHDPDWRRLSVLEGTVEQIQILYERHTPSAENPRLLLPVDGRLFPAELAEGFEEPVDGMQVSGYLVLLRGCSVRPAEAADGNYP